MVVFENLHWIDSETQALLDSLIESLPTARILLVNYRPEYQHHWGSKTYYTQLRLDPLSPDSAEELLQALLGDDASLVALKRLLIARTEGNPFFLEESIRTLVETQVLHGERGNYRLVQALPTVQVPATVQALLAARIDRLPLEEKRLLQVAAVIGTDVSFPLLQAIAEQPEEALRRGLTHLQVAEFLYETRLFPELEYTFKHALTHQVAYESLLQEHRRDIHARIVEAFEQLYADRRDEQIERLAHHALRGEVWEKALPYFRQAGIKAAASSAYREAVTCFEQALIALKHLPENQSTIEQAIDIRFDLRNTLFSLGELKRILDYLSEAETLAKILGDQRRLGQVYTYMASCFWLMGDHERAVEASQHALTFATALGNIDLQVMANYRLGQAYYYLGDYRKAIDYFKSNVAVLKDELRYKRFGMVGLPFVFSRTFLIHCLTMRGEFAEGIIYSAEGVQIAEEVDHPFSLIHAYSAVGSLYLHKGELQKSISVHERGLELSRVLNLPFFFPLMASPLGYGYALSSRIGEALPLGEKAVEETIAMGRVGELALWTSYLSETYLWARRIDEALEQALQALALSRRSKERGNEAWTLRLLGETGMLQNWNRLNASIGRPLF